MDQVATTKMSGSLMSLFLHIPFSLSTKMDDLLYLKDNFKRKVENEEMQPAGRKRTRDARGGVQHLSVNFNSGGNVSHGNQSVGNVNFNLQVHQDSERSFLDDLASTRLPMVEKAIVGSCSVSNIEKVLNLLKEDDVSVIGIHGMGGVGKTTLLKSIYNKLFQDSDIKGQVYWVEASHDCDRNLSLRKLQIAIGKRLGLRDIEEQDNETRKSWIFHGLCHLKKSVLIIDDLWIHYTADEIGIPRESCKIVITTRSLDVCRKVGCQKFIQVLPLSSDDAMSLFVESSVEVPKDFTVMARRIVKQCGGLPLALVIMGICMRGVTDVHQWKNALFELEKPASRLDNDMEKNVFRVLRFSYDSLKDECMKKCFLSSVLFGEDSDIFPGELIDLWIMEGLLDDVEGWENKVNKGHTILNSLESSSLLESTTSKCVRMHDLIRDMAMILAQHGTLCMAKAGSQLNKVPKQDQWTCELVKVSLSHNSILRIPCGMSPDTPKLRVLILSHNPLREIPELFFVHMKALQMLDLSGTDITRLPDTVYDLENLRGLFLRQCCSLMRVRSLAKLTKLMALDLPGTDCWKGGVEGLERLRCLERLYNYYCPWSVLDLHILNNLMLFSGQLKSYRIELGWKTYFPGGSSFKYEKEIRIRGLGGMVSLPWTIQSLHIEESSREGPRSLEEALPSLRHATDLRNLVIKGWEGLKYVFISPASREDSSNHPLHSLYLESLGNLTRISKNGVYPLFSNLKSILITRCPKIRVVFPSPRTQEQCIILPYLETICVSKCHEVEEIIESNKESSSSQTIDHIINPTFPNLQSLYLTCLPRLGSIYSMRLHLCTSLKDIKIDDCPRIDGIFSDTISEDGSIRMNLKSTCEVVPDSVALPKLRCFRLERLPKLGSILPLQLHLCTCLEEITIKDCPVLESVCEEIFEANKESSSCEAVDHRVNVTKFNPAVPLPNLRRLQLSDLPKLGSIYSLQLHRPTSLEVLEICNCPKIEGLFKDAIDNTELVFGLPSLTQLWLSGFEELRSLYLSTSLESITLSDCPKIEGVFTCPRDNVDLVSGLPSLSFLRFSGLPELRSIYPMQLHLSTSLGTVVINGCPKLEGIFRDPTGVIKPILAFPKLEHLVLEGLPSMSSIYRGLLICCYTPRIEIKECPQLRTLSLLHRMICDASTSTLASFPTQPEDPVWWEPLHRDYPDDVLPLSDYIHQARRGSPMPQTDYNEGYHEDDDL